jgi:hypothetical protein
VGVSPVNFVTDGKKLLQQIQRYDLSDEVAPQPITEGPVAAEVVDHAQPEDVMEEEA